MIDLNILGEKRLEIKKKRMENLLKIALPDEALYREIMVSLGYKDNKTQFLNLAVILPFSEIRRLQNREIIKDAMLYRAGFIDKFESAPAFFDLSLRMKKNDWVLKKVRPMNRPDLRMENISFLLEKCCGDGIYEYFKKKIDLAFQKRKGKSSKTIVEEIMSFPNIGMERKREIFFNIILPFYLTIFGRENEKVDFLKRIYDSHPELPDNSISKKIKQVLKIKKTKSVKEYMGLIQYYYENSEKEEENYVFNT